MKYQEWRDILQKENKTPQDIVKMNFDSSYWNSCAIGAKFICDLEKSELLPKGKKLDQSVCNVMYNNHRYVTTDHIYDLGYNHFMNAIDDAKWDNALAILDEIYNTDHIYNISKSDAMSKLSTFIVDDNPQ